MAKAKEKLNYSKDFKVTLSYSGDTVVETHEGYKRLNDLALTYFPVEERKKRVFERNGFFRWKTAQISEDEVLLLKSVLKVWKITDYCWGIVYTDIMYDRVKNVAAKKEISHYGGVMTILGMCLDLIGNEALTNILPEFTAFANRLSGGLTKFEEMLGNDRDLIAISVFTEYGVLAPNLTKEDILSLAEKKADEEKEKWLNNLNLLG